MMLDIERATGLAVSTTLRVAVQADLDQVLAMHRRCSPESLYRRYVSGAGIPAAGLLARLLEPAVGQTVLAIVTGGPADGQVVAAANLVGCGDGAAEAAILVEDAWQRRGIGTALARRLVAVARAAAFTTVLVHVLAGNQPATRTIRRLTDDGTLGGPTLSDRDGPLLTLALAPG
jgi:GNAT superfamily N-acetyltransferase